MQIDRFEDVAGRPWSSLWPEGERERVARGVETALAGGSDRFEAFCPTGHGEPRWWDVSVAPIHNAGGGVERIVSISRDITARVEHERRMAEHEARLLALTEAQAAALAERDGLLEEKRLLMHEVDHRVKNSLAMINSLLRIQGRSVQDANAREALELASMRVRTIASVHERL